DQHPRLGLRERRPLPRGRQAGRRDWLAGRQGPSVRDVVLRLRSQGGPCLRRYRHSVRILSDRPRSGRPWNAPSTSLAGVGGALDAPFLFAREQAERPFVALKLATSIDGRIADAAGSSQWVSGEAAREHVHWLRAGFDAIAVGGTTALRDDPQLTVRGPVTPRRPPVRVVFDRRAMLNLGVQL